jgi:SAM-dependent methyltransferase
MVSRLAAQHMKVVLGGQGGDEIFGGYARYLLAYFEQCIKAAIDGTMRDGNFVVTYESIIPQLGTLREYKPLMQQFWRTGLFGDLDARYFRLIDRAPDLRGAIDWNVLGDYSPFETFESIFRAGNVRKESYFDLMTHFDFKTLLPALLHVEDRVSMAHGLESRVPLIDTEVVEFAATLPADVKFKHGHLKHALKEAMRDVLPPAIVDRRDKMGFPVPLAEWINDELRDFVLDVFSAENAKSRPYLAPDFDVRELIENEGAFGRNLWGLFSLELWQQVFHDRSAEWRSVVGGAASTADGNRIDERNRAFWDELCGTGLAASLGITEITPTSLARFDEAYMAYYPYLAEYLRGLPLDRREVLEIGLGFGTVGQILATRGAHYHGADIAAGPAAMMQDRLRWLGQDYEGAVVQTSALDLPWVDETFDLVVSIGCLHHTGDLPRAVSEVHRVLAPDGLAFVMLYNAHSFRQLARVPRARLRSFRDGRSSTEEVRAMYDVNTAGEAAPHTDYVSRQDIRRLFGAFSTVSVDAQNFDPVTLPLTRHRVTIARERLLGNVARVLGLDLYVHARR